MCTSQENIGISNYLFEEICDHELCHIYVFALHLLDLFIIKRIKISLDFHIFIIHPGDSGVLQLLSIGRQTVVFQSRFYHFDFYGPGLQSPP